MLIYSEQHGKYFHATIYDRAARLSANMAADEVKRVIGALAELLYSGRIRLLLLLPRSAFTK